MGKLLKGFGAAVFGLLDLLTIARGTPAFRTGLTHMALNLAVVVLFAISFALRRDHLDEGDATVAAVNLAGAVKQFAPIGALPAGVAQESYARGDEFDFRPWLLGGALSLALIDLIVAYALLRSRMRAPVPVGERDSYQSVSSGTTVTPESLALNPRAQPLREPDAGANVEPVKDGAEPA